MYNKRKVTEDNSGGKNKTILLLSFARKGEDGMVCPMLGKVSSRVSEDKQKGFLARKNSLLALSVSNLSVPDFLFSSKQAVHVY